MKIAYKNIEIGYTLSGKGPTVVWLHGFLENRNVWDTQIPFFDNHFTNICIDLLGHGETGNLCFLHSMEMQAEAVKAVLHHLKINEFAVIGHSMGGYVALSLIQICSTMATHMVLLNSTSNADSLERKANRDRAIAVIDKQKDVYIRMGIVNLFAESFKKLHSQKVDKLIAEAQKISSEGIKAALMGMRDRLSKTKVLSYFKGKKLIIAGKNDPILSSKKLFAEAELTGSKFVAINGGHMTHMEATAELNEKLLDFLQK
ncbi:alpha/beta fold hydrolase [Aquimarina agarivorans]|uniref:alpha/beta fold hydrolase n=1 Tax=Aquimarina agarivorans TaxID=980584 RepID=UPI000248E70F|nr:alpha/beta hydrolase [Aquimarina agarivorans]